MDRESVFSPIKGNRLFRRFLLRDLDKVHAEVKIMAWTHNLLKVAGIYQLPSGRSLQKQTKKRKAFSPSVFRNLWDSSLFIERLLLVSLFYLLFS
ncbi:hypothetical protein ACQKDD_03100 [Planococcus kocurii]|uniref:hypothetical protein n=1 Tax=Planococcus kocurii TaxID=1374 RepID=UPI003D078369